MKVIVTGGSGRLGRSVVRVLADHGHEVTSVDNHQVGGLPAAQVSHDLTDIPATARLFADLAPDGVVHLAAISVPFSLPDPEIFRINTTLGFSVLEATITSGAHALLAASSPTVIGYNSPTGWKPDYLPLDEEHRLAPWNGYSLSKQSIEQLLDMAVRAHGDDIRVGSFRPCYVIAPEEWDGAPTQQGHTVAERLAKPELSAVALFNYLDARDAGQFVHRWLTHAPEVPNGSRFFVGAPDSLVREPVGPALARLVPEATDAAATLDPEEAVFSSARAEQLLGWRAQHTWRTELAQEGVRNG